jgi:hypothetical protein
MGFTNLLAYAFHRVAIVSIAIPGTARYFRIILFKNKSEAFSA